MQASALEFTAAMADEMSLANLKVIAALVTCEL